MDFCYAIEIELGFGFEGLTSGLGDRFCVSSVFHCVEEHVIPSRVGTKLNNEAARWAQKWSWSCLGHPLIQIIGFSLRLSFYLFSCFSYSNFFLTSCAISVCLPASFFFFFLLFLSLSLSTSLCPSILKFSRLFFWLAGLAVCLFVYLSMSLYVSQCLSLSLSLSPCHWFCVSLV